MSERNKALSGIYSSSLGKTAELSMAIQKGQIYRTGPNSFSYVGANGSQKSMTLAQARDLAENVEIVGTSGFCKQELALIEAEKLLGETQKVMARISNV